MRYFSSFLLLFLTFSALGQKKQQPTPIQKKPLSHLSYDSWKEITYKAITPDGSFAAYTINPQDGDGKVVFHNLNNNQQDSVKRADNISFSWDSQFAAFKIKPQQKLVKDLRRQKKKKEDMPQDSLGIYSFTSRKAEKIANVKSYKMPERFGGWIAYLNEPVKEPKAKPDAKKPSKKIKKNSDDNGFMLTLRTLDGKQQINYGYVKDFLFAKYGQGLLFTSTGNDSTLKAGVYWHNLSTGALTALHQGKAKFKYKGLALNEEGNQVAFLLDSDTTKALIRNFEMFHWKAGQQQANKLELQRTVNLPFNWMLNENYTPLFSKNGQKLFFGTSPKPLVQDTTLLTEEIVQVEVWGGNDEYIYPQQVKRLDNEKKRSYLSVIDFAAGTTQVLGTTEIPDVEMGNEGNADVVLMTSDKPYRKMTTWDQGAFSDFYILNLKDGKLGGLAKKVKGNAHLSPQAKYAFWFSDVDTAWYTHRVGSDSVLELTVRQKKMFVDEENDSPDYANNYGLAGWTTNDTELIIYDRYDIWSVDPRNKREPINLTKIGRQQKVAFRYLRLDPDQRNIDIEKDLLLSAFDETTKASGYYRFNIKTGALTKLVMDNYRFGGTIKAKNADKILFTRENFREFPDVWMASASLTNMKKLSDANPQMKNYFWGTVELVKWNSYDNIPLTGMLYKPEGFDPKKKYPMITYFYEKESDNLNAYQNPFPHRSAIVRSTYVSDGYLVFVPDIVYKVGYPGQSAYNCVVSGVESLIKTGFVDEKDLGIQGHSWGGYQTAYIITKTNIFKAAEAGAVVANMTSAYGGIRWGTGISRMFQYEHTQSRIGATLWEKPNLYLENSPLFTADKITTPLLLLQNDMDDAVPWYQGIELYMALRRMNKPVWMLNYNGEPHWPVKRENRMDFQIRMKQFFDSYLKGAPTPEWMTKGVSAVEKGILKGY